MSLVELGCWLALLPGVSAWAADASEPVRVTQDETTGVLRFWRGRAGVDAAGVVSVQMPAEADGQAMATGHFTVDAFGRGWVTTDPARSNRLHIHAASMSDHQAVLPASRGVVDRLRVWRSGDGCVSFKLGTYSEKPQDPKADRVGAGWRAVAVDRSGDSGLPLVVATWDTVPYASPPRLRLGSGARRHKARAHPDRRPPRDHHATQQRTRDDTARRTPRQAFHRGHPS